MLRLSIVFAALLVLCSAAAKPGGTAEEVRAAYLRFAEAQNAHSLDRIRTSFIDGPELLWVSDGMSFWGADAILRRMSLFQRSEVWRVEPALEASNVVELGPDVAMLHMPLTLVIGAAAAPDRLPFLVSILFRRVDGEWRIAALLTTTHKV